MSIRVTESSGGGSGGRVVVVGADSGSVNVDETDDAEHGPVRATLVAVSDDLSLHEVDDAESFWRK
jgi:hypothetical protein